MREGRIGPDDVIAIVGGGVAGITAAAYALRRGMRVTVFEKFNEPFMLQQGSGRWLHPAIYDWPTNGWKEEGTSLPCMNWRAGPAVDVVATLRREWHTLRAKPQLAWAPNTTITRIEPSPEGAILQDSTTKQHGPFKCIILAAGFGEEADLPEFDCKPYWRDDDLHQRLRHGGVAFVSGCGDGGLIDAIRVAVLDFRHDWLAKVASKAAEDEDFIAKLLHTERNTPAFPDGAALTAANLAIAAPRAVSAMIKERLRPDTSVVLNAGTDGPLTRTACLINRFVVTELMRLGTITYAQGQADLRTITRVGERFNIPISGSQISADLIVVRHGPKIRPLALFPDIEVALRPARAFLRTYRAGVDRTRTRVWGEIPPPPPPTTTSLAPLATEILAFLGNNLRNAIKDDLARRGVQGAVVRAEQHERSIDLRIIIGQREHGIHVALLSGNTARLSNPNGPQSVDVTLEADAMSDIESASRVLVASIPAVLSLMTEEGE
jgi:hypothetical protein